MSEKRIYTVFPLYPSSQAWGFASVPKSMFNLSIECTHAKRNFCYCLFFLFPRRKWHSSLPYVFQLSTQKRQLSFFFICFRFFLKVVEECRPLQGTSSLGNFELLTYFHSFLEHPDYFWFRFKCIVWTHSSRMYSEFHWYDNNFPWNHFSEADGVCAPL